MGALGRKLGQDGPGPLYGEEVVIFPHEGFELLATRLGASGHFASLHKRDFVVAS